MFVFTKVISFTTQLVEPGVVYNVPFALASWPSDNDLNENFKANYNDLVFENCIEGTLLRVYYYNGSFRVATKKCIDANKSKWGSEKSFAELLNEIAASPEASGSSKRQS